MHMLRIAAGVETASFAVLLGNLPDGAPPSRESADCLPYGGSTFVPEEANPLTRNAQEG